jgi:hypothetical protein
MTLFPRFPVSPFLCVSASLRLCVSAIPFSTDPTARAAPLRVAARPPLDRPVGPPASLGARPPLAEVAPLCHTTE